MDTTTWLSNSTELKAVSEMTNEQLTEHWVTEMFPVTYTLDNTDGITEKESQKTSIFEQLAQRLSPLDETALKNVYEKVWLMMHLAEKEKHKREQEENQTGPQEVEDKAQTTEGKRSSGSNKLGKTSTLSEGILKIPSGVSTLGVDDAAIWSSGEIAILRQAFKKTKDENHQLRAEIHILKNDINKINKKYRHVDAASESRTEKLNIAVKANERLQIAVDSLKLELKKAEASIQFLNEQLVEERERRCKVSKEVHHLRLDLDREKLSRRKLELDKEQEEEARQRKTELLKERLASRHRAQIDKLNGVLMQLQSDLKAERENHSRSKRALDHLRSHFASTDLQIENSNVPGPVTKDQLSKWTY